MAEQKPRPRPSPLVAAARAQSRPVSGSGEAGSSGTPAPRSAAPPPSAGPSSLAMVPDPTRSSTVSDRTTPGGTPAPELFGGPSLPLSAMQKPKFKPKIPIKKAAPAPSTSIGNVSGSGSRDVKPDVRGFPSRGGAPRGRGRGGPPMRGRTTASATVVAAGPLSAVRSGPPPRRTAAPPPRRPMDEIEIEDYSDASDGEAQAVIDIDAVSRLGESAPTSLYRQRDLSSFKGGKGKEKTVGLQAQRRKIRRNRRRRIEGTGTSQPSEDAASSAMPGSAEDSVKAEPISPDKAAHVTLPGTDTLDDELKHVPSRLGRRRGDDTMVPSDEMQDRDERGRRVRAFARAGGLVEDSATPSVVEDDEEVDEAQRVDLSESDEEEEEESMEGDFVYVEGHDDPSDKLFTFQFPGAFPKFIPHEPVGGGDSKEGIAAGAGPSGTAASVDIKPNLSAMRGRRKAQPPPEGRVGTLVVMKSGRVKMVLGDDIVMNVTPGVSPSFLQQIVHVDSKEKSNAVLGEVHKNYVVTPDIDRLLEELFVSGGVTPGERERERIKQEQRERIARGELVKVER